MGGVGGNEIFCHDINSYGLATAIRLELSNFSAKSLPPVPATELDPNSSFKWVHVSPKATWHQRVSDMVNYSPLL
jgi:hypothetical protein